MKKILSLIFFTLPFSVCACAGEVIPGSLRNIILWTAAGLCFISLLSVVGYTISYILSQNNRKVKVIIISSIILSLSFFVILFIFATDRLLCGSSQF